MDGCRVFCFILVLLIGRVSSGQLKIGGDPHQIHPYALLDLESTDKALLHPRLTTLQRNEAFTRSIPVGLLYYNTDLQRIEVWTSEQTWMPLAYLEENSLNVAWDSETFSLQIGNSPLLDLSALRPASPQQLSLVADQLTLDESQAIDLSIYRDDPQQLSLIDD